MTQGEDPPDSRFEAAIGDACRFIDWWFTPRCRALVTWTLVPPVSYRELRHENFANIKTWIRATLDWAGQWIPLGAAHSVLQAVWFAVTASVIVCWVQPLALRLGWWRSLLWMSVMIFFVSLCDRHPFAAAAVVMIGTSAIMIGRRRRPWMPIPATLLIVGLIKWTWSMFGGNPHVPSVAVANLLFGVVLIFGTEPIEREAFKGTP